MCRLERAFRFSLMIAIATISGSCFREEQIPVAAEFAYTIPKEGYTVPVQIDVTNNTTGADFYSWTFEGASPAASDAKHPGTIQYSEAGTYTIKLEAWNDTQRSIKEITIELDSAVTIDFDYEIVTNDFVPAVVNFINNTLGASTFEWTFEGGEPESSNLATPPPVHFDSPGDHLVTLTVTNGRETFSTSRTITLKPSLEVDFSIVPSFEDEDYEAPLKASLVNNSMSGLRYAWSCDGGTIDAPASENASVSFDAPGTYTVTLTGGNDKETKSVERTITVKPNTNLYTMQDVRLGISAAHSTIGCFYSTVLRKTLTKDEVTFENSRYVDLVFYGINSGFSYSRFVSPDSTAKFTFPSVPQASHTAFVNTLESSLLSFSASDFDAMIDDTLLKDLVITDNDSGTKFFNNSVVPRVVLFETSDGRKGAIKIKSFVNDGMQSYILIDIKVQK